MYIFYDCYFYKCIRHCRCCSAFESVIRLQRKCYFFFLLYDVMCPEIGRAHV